MLKKLMSAMICTMMVLSVTVVSFANDGESATFTSEATIYIECENDIIEFINSEEYDVNTKYTFRMELEDSQRRYCYVCGGPNMTSYVDEDQTDYRIFACRYPAGMGQDRVTFFDIYYVESCRDCGMEESEYLRAEANVYCSASARDFLAEEGNTMEDGYDIHECLSTYS